MGRKGLQTRRRLIDATVGLLETTRLRDLRVVDIARTAGTSTATFYVYFPDVSDAVLAALEEVTQSTPEILALVDQDWREGDPEERARRIVERYAQFWLEHSALFRVRNLAADEGDERFVNARASAITGLLTATAAAIERAQEAGWVTRDLDATATSSVLMAMLERFGAIQYHYSHSGLERARMIVAAAHFLAHAVGPPPSARRGRESAGEYGPSNGEETRHRGRLLSGRA